MKTIRRQLPAIFLLSLCLTLTAQAQSSDTSPQLTQSVTAGGGGTSASGNTQLDGTIGQGVTATSTGGTYTLSSGFWPGAGTLVSSTLFISDATATYGGTVSLSVKLTANGAILSNRLVTFSLNGTTVGTASTDANGLATLSNVGLSGINAGTYAGAVTAQFAGDLSFAASSGMGQLTVQKATPIIQVVGGTFTYDGQAHPAIASVAGVNNESLSPASILYNGSNSPPVNAGTYVVVASFAGDQNYNLTTNNQQNIVVIQAGQSITFGPLSNRTYGDAPFSVNASSTSGLPVALSILSGPATISGNTITITGAGTVNVHAAQAGDGNHSAAAPVDQQFIISKADQAITFNALLPRNYGDPPFTVSATGGASGIPVAFSSQTTAVCSVSGNTVTILAAGSCTIMASQAGNDNYNAAASLSQTFSINKATPVIAWGNPSDITYGTPLGNAQLNATANVAGTFSYTPAAGTILSVGTSQLSVIFKPTDAANYTTSTESVSLTVEQVMAAALNLDSATYTVSEGDGHVTMTVNRTGNGTGPATVAYATSDTAGLQDCFIFNGIASSRCDYATTTGTLRFSPGEISKTISIPLVDDLYAEGPETFRITLSNAVGESLGAVTTAVVTVTDNDLTTAGNPILDPAFFIRQQYIDFLGRDPDPPGLSGWLNILNNCGTTVAQPCDRIEVSSGFFRSPEFQSRGYFIFRFYSALLGRNPTYAEFMPDLGRVSGFLTDAQLDANKTAFVQQFMTRSEYVSRYGSLSNPAFVDTLIQASGLESHPLRGPWIDLLNNGTATRAEVLRAFVESKEVYDRFYNQAFVVMQYFGYLRRDPDALYTQWVETLNRTGDFRMMISGFLNSNEYVRRFGP